MFKNLKLILMMALILQIYSGLFAELNQFQTITLSGKDGGYANGKDWSSDDLLGKVNVIFYVDPDKFSEIKQFISDLEQKKVENNNFDLVFIVNTKATILPSFVIKSRIKKKDKKSKTISYVLDENKVLIKKWELKDNSVNVLILDESNNIIYRYSDKIKTNQIEEIMKIINSKN